MESGAAFFFFVPFFAFDAFFTGFTSVSSSA
jgi:hypothetical protein